MEDHSIIELYFARDESAISQTEEKYGRYLNAIAYRILNSATDAEECVEDTLLQAWQSIPPERPHFFKAFLALILVLSMAVTSSVLMIVASDEQPEAERVAGDVSGDGYVELLDLLVLRRYFANFDYDAGIPMDIEGGDFNNDGTIDNMDIITLRKYLASVDFEVIEPDDTVDNISAISPTVGTTVVLANNTVYTWYQKFDGTSATCPPITHQDLYQPVPVTFEWTCTQDAAYYLVYLSANEDLSDAKCFVTNVPTLQVENLFVATDYY